MASPLKLLSFRMNEADSARARAAASAMGWKNISAWLRMVVRAALDAAEVKP